VQKQTVKVFSKVDKEIGERMEKGIEAVNNAPKQHTEHVKAPYGFMQTLGGGY
jgi:catalase